jgi:hypothetical protein
VPPPSPAEVKPPPPEEVKPPPPKEATWSANLFHKAFVKL